MNSPTTIQFISQVKLAELHRQRSLLLETYDRLVERCTATTPAEGLKLLFDGLSQIKVAGSKLHGDLGNMIHEQLLHDSSLEG